MFMLRWSFGHFRVDVPHGVGLGTHSLHLLLTFQMLLHNVLQVVGDRPSVKEYLRLLSAVLALVSGNDTAELAKVKPFAVEAVQVRNEANC
jgi:hypothetical protein